MNISASWDGFLEVAFYIIIFGFLVRSLQVWLSDTPIGKALDYIY